MALALLDGVWSSVHEGGVALVFSVVAALGLILRRRWPYVSLALTMPALAVGYVLIAPLTALYTVAAVARQRWPVMLCTMLTGALYYLPWPPTDFTWLGGHSQLLGLIYAAVYAAAPVALGLLIRTRHDLMASLAEVQAGRDREQRLLADRVLTEERARLAREMHDVVSHQVSLIAVQAGALQVTARDDDTRAGAQTIRQLSVRTLEELRHMIGVLRGSDGAPVALVPQPRLADIARLVRDSGQHATVDLHALGGREWSEPVQRAAYRTVQEGLTNVGKHAHGASVTVTVTSVRETLRVSVRNGPSATARTGELPGSGHGLAGLRERAELLGGTMAAGATADRGFLLEVTLPDKPQVT